MTPDDAELSLDEVLGLTEYLVPLTPEKEFYERLTAGSAPRIDNMVYFLKHEIEHFKHLQEHGIALGKFVSECSKIPGREGVLDVKATFRVLDNFGYIRLMVMYWLQMMHMSRFIYELQDTKDESGAKLDLEKTIDLVMGYEKIQKLVVDN